MQKAHVRFSPKADISCMDRMSALCDRGHPVVENQSMAHGLMCHDLPFGPDPPERRSCCNENDYAEQHDQRGLLDPRNRRHKKRHDETEYANFQRWNVDAGNKRAQRQQKRMARPVASAFSMFCTLGSNSNSWRQRRPANALPGSRSGGVVPFYRAHAPTTPNTNDPSHGHKQFPKAWRRAFGEARIGHAKECKDQDNTVWQFPERNYGTRQLRAAGGTDSCSAQSRS